MEKVKEELNYLEDQLNKFGPQWNLTGVIDRMKQSVSNAKNQLNSIEAPEPTHKEQMEYLKKHDPIHYYEMTSDPCGTSSNTGCGFIFFTLSLAIIVCGVW